MFSYVLCMNTFLTYLTLSAASVYLRESLDTAFALYSALRTVGWKAVYKCFKYNYQSIFQHQCYRASVSGGPPPPNLITILQELNSLLEHWKILKLRLFNRSSCWIFERLSWILRILFLKMFRLTNFHMDTRELQTWTATEVVLIQSCQQPFSVPQWFCTQCNL